MGTVVAALIAATALPLALASSTAAASPGAAAVRLAVGPTALLTPSFGYTVAYRTVEHGDTAETRIGLFVYSGGRWRNATPRHLHGTAIDDVVFIDRQRGWLASYDCAEAAVYVYRTSDGGQSWRLLGKPATHSCGGGPTYLSFADATRGWMEPVSPNGPGGELLRTDDGGRTWSQIGSEVGSASLPCLAPIRFVSRTTGWMARCGADVFESGDAGRHWHRIAIRVPSPRERRNYDLPRFLGRRGAIAATLGRTTASSVAFATSGDSGRSWSPPSVRRIAPCPLRPNFSPWPAFWPASVASPHVWWIVAGRRKVLAQVTTDAGRDWRTVNADGLPGSACAVRSVTAADGRVAWVIARVGSEFETALFATSDAGRTWRRVRLLG